MEKGWELTKEEKKAVYKALVDSEPLLGQNSMRVFFRTPPSVNVLEVPYQVSRLLIRSPPSVDVFVALCIASHSKLGPRDGGMGM